MRLVVAMLLLAGCDRDHEWNEIVPSAGGGGVATAGMLPEADAGVPGDASNDPFIDGGTGIDAGTTQPDAGGIDAGTMLSDAGTFP